MCICTFSHVCMYTMYMQKSEKGICSPRARAMECGKHLVGDEQWTQVVCKSSTCSYLVSHLSSAHLQM